MELSSPDTNLSCCVFVSVCSAIFVRFRWRPRDGAVIFAVPACELAAAMEACESVEWDNIGIRTELEGTVACLRGWPSLGR